MSKTYYKVVTKNLESAITSGYSSIDPDFVIQYKINEPLYNYKI